MKFKQLDITGFKSFYEKTTFLIENGLTGIVGPNGCGKSNIVESLRWCMGENSAKSMRGSGMEDVIFSGTSNKPSKNISEVALILDNQNKEGPAQYKEFDEKSNERAMMVERFNSKFPDLQATIGGETGLDIFPKGWDKSQITKMHFEDCSDVYFFGDKMEEGGNDFTLAEEVISRGGQAFAVTDYMDTWETLLAIKAPV